MPDVSRAAAADGRFSLVSDIDVIKLPFLRLHGRFFDGEQVGAAGLEGVAAALQGAGEAVRVLGRTLDGPEVHHSLVELGRGLLRQELLGQGGELFLGPGGAHRRFKAEITGQDAVDVAVYHGGGEAEADGADGGGCVVSNALEGADAFQRVRKSTQRYDLFGGLVQVAGAGVVAQAFPEAEHLVFGGIGQILDGGKVLHETVPVGRSLGNTGLLEDDFTEPDGIWVAGTAPGEVPAVFCVPIQNPL